MVDGDPLAYEVRRLSARILQSSEPPPGELALRLASLFAVRPIDVDLSLAALAVHVDHEFATLIRTVAAPSELGLLAALLPQLEDRLGYFDAVGNEAPALRARLVRRIEIDGIGALVPTRRFRAAAFGAHALAALPEYATRIVEAPPDVPWVFPPAGLFDAMRGGALCLVTGATGTGKSSWARHAAFTLGGTALHVDVARAARGAQVVDELHELLDDASLVHAPVVLDNTGDLLRAGGRLAQLLIDVLAEGCRVFAIATDLDGIDERLLGHAIATLRLAAPPPEVREQLWSKTSRAIPSALAHDLVLTPRQIKNAVALVDGGLDPVAAAFQQMPRSQNLTLPDRTTATMDAIVLPVDVRAEIVELIAAIRHRGDVAQAFGSARGRAVSALFDGDSGTGKTFCCEVVAASVGLPLMRVQVASLVDKYIGETEKNLARVFEQAQAQGGILFFDEADALFGTRTDVSRAQDRYANLETNLLLQLMEQFDGVVLLTTNLKRNIDPAFMRRIMFKIYFEAPEAPERERLWRMIVPADHAAPGIDFARLGRAFELAGGAIRSAAMRAAYRASAARRPISMSDLVECAQLETQSMGRVATW